ncbi:MAG: hypothetical protein JXD23_09810 [Spirochaetales bacterium]|nr:hypothetical protein [Spirochaetales bacterium]
MIIKAIAFASGGLLTAAAGSFALDFPVTIKSTRTEAGVETRDIAFPVKGDESLMTSAWLVRPAAAGTYAGILYFHLLGPGSSRSQFLEEAKMLAAGGVVSVLIQGRTPWLKRWTGTARDLDMARSQAGEAARALDVLLAEPGVDTARTAAVGHDYGAMFLLELLTRDARIRYAVLLAFTGRFGDWINYFSKVPKSVYSDIMKPVDPLTAIARPCTTPLLLQFAREDKYIGRDAVQAIVTAAAPPCERQWVDADSHEDVHRAGAEARLRWLLPKIGVAWP